MFLFNKLKESRRRRLVVSHPIPDAVWDTVIRDRRVFAMLDAAELRRLRGLATIFVGEKDFHPVGEAEASPAAETDEFCVAVASLACLPVLELGIDTYSDWKTVIVTSDAYGITRSETDAAGVVHEYEDELGGEVLHLGPVVLSMTDVADSGRGDGYNVVIHEAAHKIDGLDGSFDGCPILPDDIGYDEWRSVFTAAYERMREAEAVPEGGKRRASRRGGKGRIRIDPYAAFSPDEFFAVCTEYFFEKPVVLRSDFPDVYRLLALFYKQDPYGRLSRT